MDLRTPLLLDGAMGTYYALRYGDDMPCELAILRHPDRIAGIHREYLRAGAQAITTDTFRADTRALGIPMEEVLLIVETAWRIACEAAGSPAAVWAGFGPPAAEANEESADGVSDAGSEPYLFEQEMRIKADRFVELGARHFLFETFDDDALPLRICAHIKAACPDAVTLVSFAVSPDGTARSGRTGSELARSANASPAVDIIGFNCISGPTHLINYLRTLDVQGGLGKPLSVMPNAGYPTITEGRTVYRNNPEYFAETLSSAQDVRISVLGGCCGTTPAHIAALASKTGDRTVSGNAATTAVRQPPLALVPATIAAAPAYNRFRERLNSGLTVLLAELDPPATADPGLVSAHAEAYRDAGADIVTIADNPLGWARADVAVTAAHVSRECRIDAMPHLTCRDRNLSAIRSQLIALHNEGIRNVLAVTGDPVPADLAANTRGVFHLNSVQLMDYIRKIGRAHV